MKIDTLLLATVPWMCLYQNRLFIKDANLISWSFISCAYFCDASSFLILNLAAFGVFSFFFSLFFRLVIFAQTFCGVAWVILSVWERAGLLQGPSLSGEGNGWNVFVFSMCLLWKCIKLFFFSFFPLFIISSVWVNVPANPLGTYRDLWYAHSFISAQSHRY